MNLSNCPINELTADKIPVGRCYLYLEDGKTCPKHGDVSNAIKYYKITGKLPLVPENTREMVIRNISRWLNSGMFSNEVPKIKLKEGKDGK